MDFNFYENQVLRLINSSGECQEAARAALGPRNVREILLWGIRSGKIFQATPSQSCDWVTKTREVDWQKVFTFFSGVE